MKRGSALVAAVAVALAVAATAGPANGPAPSGRIVFQRLVISPIGYQIFGVNADGTSLRQLTRGPERVDNVEPELSPDGRFVVFEHGPHLRHAEIELMRSDGSGVRQLTRCPSCRWSADPSFSPDGRWIIFARWEASGRIGIWRMRSDGSDQRLVLSAGAGRP